MLDKTINEDIDLDIGLNLAVFNSDESTRI